MSPPLAVLVQAKGAGPRAIYDRLRLDDEGFRESKVTLSAVKRLCQRLKRAAGVKPEDVAIPVETRPGEVAQVDFGFVGWLFDPVARVMRKAWVFVMVLGHVVAEGAQLEGSPVEAGPAQRPPAGGEGRSRAGQLRLRLLLQLLRLRQRHQGAQRRVGRKHAVVPGEVEPSGRHQREEALLQGRRRQHHRACALEAVLVAAVVEPAQPRLGHRPARAIPAQRLLSLACTAVSA